MAKTTIRANQISDGSVDNDEFKRLDGVTSAIQTQIGAKVSKVTSTDNAIPKFDGVTGEVQNSGVIIDDNDNVTMGNELKLGDGAATVKYNAVTESIDFIFV
jgi:hypothetical protein